MSDRVDALIMAFIGAPLETYHRCPECGYVSTIYVWQAGREECWMCQYEISVNEWHDHRISKREAQSE